MVHVLPTTFSNPFALTEIIVFCLKCKPILVEWRIYALVTYVNIGSDNGLSPMRCQAIIWTNADLLSIKPSGINLSEI